MKRISSELVPQALFAVTLLGALLGFGVMFDRLADDIDLKMKPAKVQHSGRPR
jgi:hypothetical protein